MDLTGIKQIMITGSLGGLGSSLARTMADSGIAIVGIDNFDPGCAPALHHRYVLNELKNFESFQFIANDIRNPFPSEVSVGDKKRLWLHCVDYTPTRHSYFDPATAEEILFTGIGRLLNDFENDQHIIFQHFSLVSEDPRLKDSEWKSVLELNVKLKNEFSSNRNCHFIELPLLYGKYQSARTNPLKLFLQFNSGIPVEVCDFSGDVIAMNLEGFVSDFSKQILNNNFQTAINVKDCHRYNQKETIHFLEEKFPEAELEVLLKQKSLGSAPVASDSSIKKFIELDALYETIKDTPHYPPFEWAKEMKRVEKERRAIRRRKQRRRKKDKLK